MACLSMRHGMVVDARSSRERSVPAADRRDLVPRLAIVPAGSGSIERSDHLVDLVIPLAKIIEVQRQPGPVRVRRLARVAGSRIFGRRSRRYGALRSVVACRVGDKWRVPVGPGNCNRGAVPVFVGQSSRSEGLLSRLSLAQGKGENRVVACFPMAHRLLRMAVGRQKPVHVPPNEGKVGNGSFRLICDRGPLMSSMIRPVHSICMHPPRIYPTPLPSALPLSLLSSAHHHLRR